jgi:iron uptake system component EfeO
VLALVAAGLVASAIHTAHEAAWLNSLQAQALDLSWLVRQGSVSSSLITGVFGIQPQPTVGETLGFLLYAVPMLVYVLWPRSVGRRSRAINTATGAVACVSLLVLAVLATGCGSGSSSASGSGSGKQLNYTLTDAGCAPAASTVAAGPVTVNVSNGGTGKVSELELKNSDGIILGERENIVSGISGSFTLSLQPGDYVLNCPNGDAEDNGKLRVTGQPIAATAGPSAAKLAAATKGYQNYVVDQSAELVKNTQQFTAALKAGDLQKAKELFGPTRIHYEAIEPVAESFGNLDPEIDARENDVKKLSDWTGFHRIEKILWQQNTTAGTEKYATKLMSDVNTLDSKVQKLTYQPAQLANGAVELLNEVANSKITGEEDRYSHTDLSDFAGNLQGAEVAFNLLAPALVSTGDAELVKTIKQRFTAVHTTLDTYKRQTPLGYALYGELTLADRKKLSQEINDLAEPLSTVAAKVSG